MAKTLTSLDSPTQYHPKHAVLANGPPTPPDELSIEQALAIDADDESQLPYPAAINPPQKQASSFEALTHRSTDLIREATNSYFFRVWLFETEKARTKYLLADLAGLACLCYPSAPDTAKLLLVAKLTAAAFLIDDIFEEPGVMGAAEMAGSIEDAMYQREAPPSGIAAKIIHDIFAEMRIAGSADLVDEVAQAMSLWLRAVVAQPTMHFSNLSAYFTFRHDDIAAPVFFSCFRYLFDLRLTLAEAERLTYLESIVGRQIAGTNDLRSWPKEKATYQAAIASGCAPGAVCNSVYVLCEETCIDEDSAQVIVEQMVASWGRRCEDTIVAQSQAECNPATLTYVEGLGSIMAGHKSWIARSRRYAGSKS